MHEERFWKSLKDAGERSLGGIFRGAEGRGALEGGFQLGGVQGTFLLGSLVAFPILWQPWGQIPGQEGTLLLLFLLSPAPSPQMISVASSRPYQISSEVICIRD